MLSEIADCIVIEGKYGEMIEKISVSNTLFLNKNKLINAERNIKFLYLKRNPTIFIRIALYWK